MHLAIAIVTTVMAVRARANIYQECAKLYNPQSYLRHLPSLTLPYLGDVAIPNNVPDIDPSPTVKTKAISVVTKYVYKNPVCVKYAKSKSMCKQDNTVKLKGNIDKLITKEYFVKDRRNDVLIDNNRHRRNFGEGDMADYEENGNSYQHENTVDFYREDSDRPEPNAFDLFIRSSESASPFLKANRKTPKLSNKQIQDMLIEDRLDQLETILPHYTRRRVYETSTITVTKVLSNRRSMATLVVKNCVPYGFELCPNDTKKRKSKVARSSNATNESHYFG